VSIPRRRLLAGLLVAAYAGLAGAPDARSPVGGGSGSEAEARESESREYGIKAAFLLNFVRYTSWPKRSFEDERSPIVLTVVGHDPFGPVLDATFKDEEVNGRRVVVRRREQVPETAEELEGHVVFCAAHDPEDRARLLGLCAKRAVLLVGETSGFAEDGACVNFYLSDHKVRFEVNPDAAAAAALEISPAVLKLAKIVRTRKER